MKTAIWVIVVIIILIAIPIAWFLISPAFVAVEADEESLLVIRDSMLSMTDSEKVEFNAAVDEMRER